jgi:hypothetical protein
MSKIRTSFNNALGPIAQRILSDKMYLSVKYYSRFGKKMNWKHPQTFNEKLNWLKLYYHEPKLTTMADKYAVKELVANAVGQDYVVPCYGVYQDFGEIDLNQLPNQFVIKATHDSSGATVCRDKSQFDIDAAKAKFEMVMKRNWYYSSREWVYKNIPHRIIVDKFLDDGREGELQDYKFWCFNGEPRLMYITNKGKNIYENFYDMDFHSVEVNHGFPRTIPEYEKPKGFEIMKGLAEKLSKGIPFVRVDFFEVGDKVYFGEFTFYDWAGLRPFADEKWDRELGDWIDLPSV